MADKLSAQPRCLDPPWVAGLPTRVGNCDGDPRRCAGATMPGEFTLVIKARRQIWEL